VHGRVLSARDRSPVRGKFDLKASDEHWDEFLPRLSGGAAFEFVDLHPGAWDVSASCPGYLSRRVRWNLEADPPDREEDIVLEPAIVVSVRIDADLPKGVSWFESLDRLGVTGLGEELASALESQGGKVDRVLEYALRYGYPAWIDVFVIPTYEEPGAFLETALAASSPIGRFRTRGSRPAPFGVRIHGGKARGLPLTDEAVVAAIEERAGNVAGPRILANGQSLEDLSPECCGVLELSEQPPSVANLVVHGCVLASVPIPRGATEVTLPLRRRDLERLVAAVHLTAVDAETGAGLVDARVDLESGIDVGPRQAGPDGSVTFSGVVPGPAMLRIQSPDREVVEDQVLIAPASTTDLGAYRLTRYSRSSVLVRDTDGKPQPVSFDVFPEDREAGSRETRSPRLFRSDDQGVLKLIRLRCGRSIVVAHDGRWASMPVLLDTTFRDAPGLELRVAKPTSVALRLRGEPPPNGRLVLLTQSGLHVDERHCRSSDPIRFALAPGSYTVELFDGDAWLWSEGLAVGEDPVRRWMPH
jgi:hypothetical protein